MSSALRAVAIAAAASMALLVTLGLTRGEQGAVIGSPHDLGVAAGAAGVSACELCHLPGDASGQRIWSDDPHAGDDGYSGIAPTCYSCHDGTVTDGGLHVFDVALAQHPMRPGEPGQDCDMCHDPHMADYGNFLRFPAGANLCKTCHASGGSEDHPLNVAAVADGSVPSDGSWNPGAGDFSGTRLWNEGGSQPGTVLKCLSCHGAHGAASESLLSIVADGRGSTALCANCHHW